MPRKNNLLADKDELSIETLSEEEVELINDTEVLERLSDDAKEKQDEALLALKENVMATIDKAKMPEALKLLSGIGYANDVLTDSEVWEKIKENVSRPSDLKYIAEAQKLFIQNVQALARADSITTDGKSAEVRVGLRWTGDGSTEVVVSKK